MLPAWPDGNKKSSFNGGAKRQRQGGFLTRTLRSRKRAGVGFKFLWRADADCFEADLLKRKLSAGLLNEAERKGIGLVAGAELDFNGLPDELREGFGHFAVQNE